MVHLTDFDFGFRPHVGEKLGTSCSYGASKDGGRREKGKGGLIHAYLAFTSPSNAIDIQSESSKTSPSRCPRKLLQKKGEIIEEVWFKLLLTVLNCDVFVESGSVNSARVWP